MVWIGRTVNFIDAYKKMIHMLIPQVRKFCDILMISIGESVMMT
jgi:hypothetical protein